MIRSFEKKPEKNINPLIDSLTKKKITLTREKLFMTPKFFKFWVLKEWIRIPAHKNIKDLKKAWIIKWKKHNNGILKDMIININPNCLNVEKATTFFKSNSAAPEKLLIIIVIKEI